jgi:hypothetical protein
MKMRYGFNRRPRAKKIRNPIRVKERIAKKGGRCAACKARYEKGDEITVVNIRRRTYHRHGCVPANAAQMPMTAGPVVGTTPEAVVKAMSSNWSPGEAKLVALMALENAMVVVGKNAPAFTEAMDRSFKRFMGAKGHILNPGNDTETSSAMKLAVNEIVKTFF